MEAFVHIAVMLAVCTGLAWAIQQGQKIEAGGKRRLGCAVMTVALVLLILTQCVFFPRLVR